MFNSQASNQPSISPVNWSVLIQLILSAITALLLLGVAALIAVTSVAQYFSQGSSSLELTQSFMNAASLAFVGVLVLPLAWYAWKEFAFPELKTTIRPEPRGFVFTLTLLVLVVVPATLWLGNWVSQYDQLSWLLLPPLNIIANGLPAFWLVYIGIRGLNPGSPRHKWGVFASGLVLGPAIVLILELLVLVGFGLLALLWAALNPSIASQLQSLIFRIQHTTPNLDALLPILLPYLLRPGILFIVFAFISVIVPIIEETLKPIGVWFHVGQKLTPAQGFAYGVLCGAGFGLFENLGNTSGGAETWAILVSTRITTLLLHCLTTGLVGWALASAWSHKRYLRLAITFAFAVVVHGLWNGMAVLSSISSIEALVNIEIPASLVKIGNLSAIGIIALGAFNLVLYISFSSALRYGTKADASLLSNDSKSPNLTVGGSISTEQSESASTSSMAFSLPQSLDAPPLPSSDVHFFPGKDNPPTNPESNP
jgi:hypothetical protein